MRLVSVTLRNYRIHRETTVVFDPDRTVLGGPNEAGKSTIVEAVHRALFLRSRTSGAVLDAMRSQFHPGHPTVELTFEASGKTYTITKQFTGTNTAPTTLTATGRPTLRNEQAEEAIERLVGAEAIGGRNAEDRLRMQWAHLWVWQGSAARSPIDHETIRQPLDRLHERLGSLGGGDVLESRLDAKIGRVIADTQAARTKDNGAPKAASPLGEAETALAAARTRLTAAQAAIAALEHAVADVDRADTAIAESEASLTDRKREQEENDRRMEEARGLEILQAAQHAAATALTATLAAAQQGDTQIRHSEARITAIEAKRAPAAERLAVACAAETEAEARAAQIEATARESRARQAAVAELAALHARAEHLERRRLERLGLAGRCERIATLRAEADELRSRLGALPAVAATDLAELAALERKRDAVQATLDAIATRVELLAADEAVWLGDRELSVGSPETIVAEADLRMRGTRLRFSPGGGTSLTEATRRRDAATAALESRLSEAGVADVDEVRRIQPLRQTLESALAAKCEAIADLGDTTAEADLGVLDAEIATIAAGLAGGVRGDFIVPQGLEAAIAARKEIDEELHALVNSLATTTATQQAADIRLDLARTERGHAEDAIRTLDDELRTERARWAVLVDEHGADRQAALTSATTACDAASAALTDTQDRLARLQPDLLRQTAGRLQRAIERLIETRQTALASRTIAMERLRSEGTLDPRDDLARAVVDERLAAARQRQAAREARAYALLGTLFVEKKREVEARFVSPLSVRVTDYLRCLYGPDAALSVDYAEGRFTALGVTRPALGGAAFLFDQLSGGGREQVAAAFRLAMAEILAEEHGGCLPIVFDDAFVNTDPTRLAGVQAMLDRAASRGLQVIVVSCNPRDYDALGAVTIALPTPTIATAAAGGDATAGDATGSA